MDAEKRPHRGPHGALRSLDPWHYLRNPRKKQRYVSAVFDLIAPRYDRFTRRFSLGMDAEWKRGIGQSQAAALLPDSVVLDLACGTGDLALGAAARQPAARVVGLDPSRPMIALAAARRREAGMRRVHLGLADMMAIPLGDAAVDVVTVGYGLRNVPDVGCALAEVRRVLKPGGWLFTLDFYRPENPLWRRLFLAYLAVAGNVYGWLWHREPAAYGYIARSIREYLTAGAFSEQLAQNGMRVERVSRKLGGGIAIHAARRSEPRSDAG